MYWEKAKYWHEYPGNKCRLDRYYLRLSRWIPREEAILQKSMRFHTTVTMTGRVCTSCEKMLPWMDFSVDKSPQATHGRTTQCKECRNIAKKKRRMDTEYREVEKEWKRNFRQSEKWRLAKEFDNKYYTDKQIKKNREIIQQVRPITREEARIAKIQYFFYRWVPVETLKKAYGDFPQYQIL